MEPGSTSYAQFLLPQQHLVHFFWLKVEFVSEFSVGGGDSLVFQSLHSFAVGPVNIGNFLFSLGETFCLLFGVLDKLLIFLNSTFK